MIRTMAVIPTEAGNFQTMNDLIASFENCPDTTLNIYPERVL